MRCIFIVGALLCAVAIYFLIAVAGYSTIAVPTKALQQERVWQSAAAGLPPKGDALAAESPRSIDLPKSSGHPIGTSVVSIVPQYSRLSLKNSLADTLSAAARSNFSEDLVLVGTLLVGCLPQIHLITLGMDEKSSLDLIATVYDSGVDPQAILREVKRSSAQLKAYCDGVDFNSYMVQMRGNPMIRQLRVSPSSMVTSRDRERNYESYVQAVTQVLASPEAFSIGLDIWLRYRLDENLPTGNALNAAQRIFIEESLFQNLSGAGGAGDVRQAGRCVTLLICTKALPLSEHQRRIALAEISRLETTIRSQRWDLLQL